jgi:alkylated DNA nucleotide flippase Atl1
MSTVEAGQGVIGPISLREIRGAGMTIADLARATRISYWRVYRAAGGNADNLSPDEQREVRRALVIARTETV